jgi:hypothetical protein
VLSVRVADGPSAPVVSIGGPVSPKRMKTRLGHFGKHSPLVTWSVTPLWDRRGRWFLEMPIEGTSNMTVKGSRRIIPDHGRHADQIKRVRVARQLRVTPTGLAPRHALWAYQDNERILSSPRRATGSQRINGAAIRSNITTARFAAAAHGSRSRFWDREAKRPAAGKFKVQVKAWLLEDFDPNAPANADYRRQDLW